MIITHRDRAGDLREADLFGTLAALARDEVDDFPALRAHQCHPWHAFAVQVAALAMVRAGIAEPPGDAEGWQTLLHALAPPEAWELVVDDWTTPALLQPPGMEAGLRTTGKRAATPDALDMLLTARNHDLKGARMIGASEEDWLFALVSLQTQEGQMGAGNYGISRMNGGYGARVALSLRPAEDRPGTAFRRDIARLRALRPQIERDAVALGGVGLVWTLPWNGMTSLSFDQLDPWYVEICRRVRLVRVDGRISAVLANSKAARIEAKALNGRTGDPWAPVDADGSKSWGVSSQGFGYRKVVDLLDGSKVAPALLARPATEDGTEDLTLHAAAVARGQGKTEGFHERRVSVPAKGVGLLMQSGDRLGTVAKERREIAGKAAGILRHALRVLAQGGPEKARADDDVTNARIDRFERLFDRAVDDVFFDAAFWDHAIERGGDDAHWLAWRTRLSQIARSAFGQAVEAMPRSTLKRLRAEARARSVLDARLKTFRDSYGLASKPPTGAAT